METIVDNILKNWKHFLWATTTSILSSLPLVLAFTFFTVPYLEKRIETAKRETVQASIESVYKILNVYESQQKNGKITLAEAQARAIEVISSLRYHETEYFWIHDLNLKMVSHPIKPELNGKSIAEMKDPNGKKLFAEMNEVVKNQKAGFVDYLWPKPGQDKPVPKISYVSVFPQWGWVLGSGVYIDDVHAEIRGVRKNNLFVFGLAFFVSVVISLVSATRQLFKVVLPVSAAVQGLTENSSGLAKTSDQIAEVSDLLSQMDREQNNQIQQTASAMTELNEMIEQTLKNSEKTTQISAETSETVDEGQDVIRKMLNAFKDIESSNESVIKAIDDSNLEISKIGQLVGEISSKTLSINEIVFQTKLLSFNASVEAARAGEHGKGFSVVAEEVGILARKSGDAAADISEIIQKSQGEVFSIVEKNKSRIQQVMSDSKEKLDLGLKTAKQCKEIFEKVVQGAFENKKMSESIYHASEEQSKGTAEIAKAIQGMESSIKKNRKIISDTLVYSQQLSKNANGLNSLTLSLGHVVGHTEQTSALNIVPLVKNPSKESFKKVA